MELLNSTLLRRRLRTGKENIIILGMIAFLAMSFWSLFSISMDMNGRMVNCPLMNDASSFCQMSLTEHINQWQQLFSMTREKSLLLSLFYLLVFTQIAVITIATKAYEALRRQRFYRYFYWYKPELKLFDYLLLVFSDGLIHSKIYA